MSLSNSILVCFAVKEEAGAFEDLLASKTSVRTLLTGIGRANAEKAIRAALDKMPKPDLVLSSGFAGGLNPELKTGAIVFSVHGNPNVESALKRMGARAAGFHCAELIATTVEEKQELWRTTGADAVEMESQIICTVCREQNISCATVRVILDTAAENLPLDFNLLMNAGKKIDFRKLALALVKSPGKIPALIRLQKQSKDAAQKLAEVLATVMPA